MKFLRSAWSTTLGSLSLAGLAACQAQTASPPPFVFNRPELVEFACIAPNGASASKDGTPSSLVLPLRCCAAATPLNKNAFFEPGERNKVCGKTTPALHALVTQSTRGEVAAVDLSQRRVLDSDPLIPGFTFVDVGGLPRAILVPPHRPGDPNAGPLWTYIASAEDQVLRAVATCHFRDGAACGPEAKRGQDEFELALPAQSRDMVLGPDDALWLTLPDISALARVPLPTEGDAPFGPGEVTFFELPVASAVTPAPPVAESPEYQASCGLGYTVQLEKTALLLPSTPPVAGLGRAAPTRLRFDQELGLMLVADGLQPVIHALSIESEGVRVRATIATGVPVRDFALTPAVPKQVPEPRAFVDSGSAKRKPKFDPDEQRYLYAIDDLDGSVMVQAFTYLDGVVSAQPLQLPAARVRRDRLNLEVPATAIAIVDNRLLTNGFVCDWEREAGLDRAIKRQKSTLDSAQRALRDAQDQPDKDEALAAARQAYNEAVDAYNKLATESTILNTLGALSLHGVFALITTLDGRLAVVDIHDLDVFCRGEAWCRESADGDGDIGLSNESRVQAVAVRRHAVRLAATSAAPLNVSTPKALEAVACAEGQYTAASRPAQSGSSTSKPEPPSGDAGADDAGTPDAGGDAGVSEMVEPGADKTLVCNTTDPWLNLGNPGWLARWEGTVYASPSGRFDADSAQTVFYAPEGAEMCARGVLGGDSELGGYEGDWLVIVGAPPSYAPRGCEVPERGSEPQFRIVSAFQDRLVLGEQSRGPRLNRKCYPDVVTFEVRAAERFVVYPQTRPLLHRIKADAAGRCVPDSEQDARLVARAEPGIPFTNAFATLRIARDAAKDRAVSLDVLPSSAAGNAQFLGPIAPSAQVVPVSLPASVRYLSITGDAFVVDVAQGLRRFQLTPYAPDNTLYR